jgi:hypothetical protein
MQQQPPGAPRAGLADVPHDVLCQVMRLAGQSARTACFTASKQLSAAATARGVWGGGVTFYDLDRSAVEFVRRHRPARVRVDGACPDDVSWFFDTLRDEGLTTCIRHLLVRLGVVQRVPSDLLDGIGAQSELERLDVFVEDLDQPCNIYVPDDHRLTKLRTLSVTDGSPCKELFVLFRGAQPRLTSLRSLELDVGMSDVMHGLRHMPALRRVVYRYEEDNDTETYEDAWLEGLDLDALEVSVGAQTDYRHLYSQIARCVVRDLVLHVADDWVDINEKLSPALESLTVCMHVTSAEVRVDFPFLLEYERLRRVRLDIGAHWITEEPMIVNSCHHTLIFGHVHAIDDWVAFQKRVEVLKHPTTSVLLAPT